MRSSRVRKSRKSLKNKENKIGKSIKKSTNTSTRTYGHGVKLSTLRYFMHCTNLFILALIGTKILNTPLDLVKVKDIIVACAKQYFPLYIVDIIVELIWTKIVNNGCKTCKHLGDIISNIIFSYGGVKGFSLLLLYIYILNNKDYAEFLTYKNIVNKDGTYKDFEEWRKGDAPRSAEEAIEKKEKKVKFENSLKKIEMDDKKRKMIEEYVKNKYSKTTVKTLLFFLHPDKIKDKSDDYKTHANIIYNYLNEIKEERNK